MQQLKLLIDCDMHLLDVILKKIFDIWYRNFVRWLLSIFWGVIIINLFIVGDKNTIKNIFVSKNVALNTWLI